MIEQLLSFRMSLKATLGRSSAASRYLIAREQFGRDVRFPPM